MKNIRNRPLFCFCVLFLAFSAVLTDVPSGVKAITAAVLFLSAAVLLAVSLVGKKTILRSAVILTAALAAASALSYITFGLRLGAAEKHDGETVNGTIVIRDMEFSSANYGIYHARLDSADARFDVLLTTRDGGYSTGDVLEGDVTLSSFTDGGPYNERGAYLPDGMMMAADEEELSFVRHDGSLSVSGLISSARRSVRSRFEENLSGSASGLSTALLLGDRSGLSPVLKRDFSRTGTSHLLAISGLHLSVILFMLSKLFEAFSVRRVPRVILSVSFIFLFAALTGFSSSVMRAGLMHAVAISATLFGRRGDPYTSLGVAGVFILCLDGFAVLDPGLWLSLLSAFACLRGTLKDRDGGVVRAPAAERNGIRKIVSPVLSSVKMTFYITICTLPVTWLVFGEASVVSPLTNIVFIPLVTVFLIAAFIFALISSSGIPTAPLAAFLNSYEKGISALSGAVSKLKGIVWSVRGAAAGAAIFALFVLALIAPLLTGKAKKVRFGIPVFAVILAATVAVPAFANAGTAEGKYVLGRSSDGIVLRVGNEYAVVDSSLGSNTFARRIVYECRESGACEIDTYALTHCHPKHVSVLFLITGTTVIRRVLVPEPATAAEEVTVNSIREICESRGVQLTEYPSGGTASLHGGAEMKQIGGYTVGRSTHPVISYVLTHSGSTVLYLGPSAAERTEAETEAAESASVVIFGAHPKVRRVEEIPPSPICILAPEAVPEGDLIPENVSVPTRDRDGFGTVPFEFN